MHEEEGHEQILDDFDSTSQYMLGGGNDEESPATRPQPQAPASAQKPPGWNPGEPVKFEFIVKFWNVLYRIPKIRMPLMQKINAAVFGAIMTKTVGAASIVMFVKPKFATNTVGAILEMADSGVANIIPAFEFLKNVAIKMPGIHLLLKELRDRAYPILLQAGRIQGVREGVSDIRRVAGDIRTKGVVQTAKDAASDRINTFSNRAAAAEHLRDFYQSNEGKEESKGYRQREFRARREAHTSLSAHDRRAINRGRQGDSYISPDAVDDYSAGYDPSEFDEEFDEEEAS